MIELRGNALRKKTINEILEFKKEYPLVKFNFILNEKNEFKLGTIITVFSLPNTPKEIVLFSVGDYDSSDTASLEVAYLNKDKDGYNYIEEIDDDKVLKEAMKVVKKVILLGEQ